MRVRVVHLEDDESERERVARTLRAEEIDCANVQADSRGDFERALDEPPGLILSDYSIPGFAGDEAQDLAQARCPGVPFVFVSGSIGEERAVERLKKGATDYVLKDRLDKLAPAVKRVIREADERRRRTAVEAELRRLNVQLEARIEQRTRALVIANKELQQARHEADRANRAKSEFLSRMSHDLRTPLNAIMEFAQLFNLDGLPAEHADSVNHILRGGEHLLSLINEVLDIARIESGYLTLSPEPVSVADGLTALGKDLRLEPGSTDLLGPRNPQLSNDPDAQWMLRSSIGPWRTHELDAMVRHVGELPNPAVPAYVAVDMRYAWRLRPDLELSLLGQNLFDRSHGEFNPAASRSEFERSVFVQARWSR